MAKHLVSTAGVYYTKIIPTRSTKTRAGGRSIMMELEVIINPSLHMKKKLNRRIITNKQATSTHPSTTSTKAVLVTTTTITELVKVKVPFMMIIRWKKRSIQVQLVTLRLKKRKVMLVQTTSILWKVLMIPVQIQTQTVMRYLATVYLSCTTITFKMKIGMLMPTWTRQRCQYGVHSLALRRANNMQLRMRSDTLLPLKQ
ncbi:unnamed protein product [Linum trigynum]|uniref:Uncharacterized protein n=1 Tax=Linum trigynum TaxID=586398 RepID=A0AAV2GRL2_9ROSI